MPLGWWLCWRQLLLDWVRLKVLELLWELKVVTLKVLLQLLSRMRLVDNVNVLMMGSVVFLFCNQSI